MDNITPPICKTVRENLARPAPLAPSVGAPLDVDPVVLARIGHTVVDPAEILYEDHIVWRVSPDEIAQQCRYVREGRALRCTRMRPITGDHVVAYAVLRSDAPPGRPWMRRFWFLTDGDPFPVGEAPCEAVDVRTIAPRVPGRVTERVLFGRDIQ